MWCLRFAYIAVLMHCFRSIMIIMFDIYICNGRYALCYSVLFVLFDSSICTGWYVLCQISTVCTIWVFHMYRLICTVLDQYWLAVWHFHRYWLICTVLDQYCFCCLKFNMYRFLCTVLDQFWFCSLKFPYVPLDMHSVRSILIMLFEISICTG